MKKGTFLVKNSSQTVEIKDKTNKKKPYLEQNISNHKLDGSNLDDSIKIFNNLISEEPIYMCSVANKHKATALHKAYWLPCCLLGGLSLHLNHLIASGMTIYDWPFGTFPFRLFGSNLDTRDLETYPRTYSGHF